MGILQKIKLKFMLNSIEIFQVEADFNVLKVRFYQLYSMAIKDKLRIDENAINILVPDLIGPFDLNLHLIPDLEILSKLFDTIEICERKFSFFFPRCCSISTTLYYLSDVRFEFSSEANLSFQPELYDYIEKSDYNSLYRTENYYNYSVLVERNNYLTLLDEFTPNLYDNGDVEIEFTDFGFIVKYDDRNNGESMFSYIYNSKTGKLIDSIY